jgi:aspartyl-tRNA synthetase
VTEPTPILQFRGEPVGLRTDYCGALRAEDVGRTVSVAGWVDSRREHGEHLAFIDLRDRTGVVLCVVVGAQDLRAEYVVRITGAVRERPEGTRNDGLSTGAIEIGDAEVEVLATSEPLPFPIDDRQTVDETLRLRHRYVDLRRARMQRNLLGRSTVNAAIRTSMERQGFVEVETPMLIASTPEGARDFVVPSRPRWQR